MQAFEVTIAVDFNATNNPDYDWKFKTTPQVLLLSVHQYSILISLSDVHDWPGYFPSAWKSLADRGTV